MRAEEFRKILTEAVAGNHQALDSLLRLYMPLINNHSYINDKFDEDLRPVSYTHLTLPTTPYV